ncbi:MAG TPA: hypothetical protein VG184_08945, partial [Acidimicrobiales bacterium]|nr:hypothetical protein [Acidimicrobiales bacterium]
MTPGRPGGGAPQESTPPATAKPRTSTPAPAPATSASAPPHTAPAEACSDASVVRAWPLSRRAAQVVVVPSLNFDVAALGPLVADGVGGVLLLGSGAAPVDLAARLGALDRVAPGGVAPLAMADEEGGGVQRLAGVVAPFAW